MAVSSDITAKYAAYVDVVQASPEERIDRIRRGLQPTIVGQLASDLRIPDHNLALYLGLNRASLRRRIADEERLSPQESEGLLAMASLAGIVVMACRQPSVEQGIVADPLAWLGRWLRTPLPSLESRRAPIEYMDVVEGRSIVATWLAAALSPVHLPGVSVAAWRGHCQD